MSALPPKATAIALGRTYKDWQSEHGLYLGDVPEIPEHLVDGHLTSNEREWLRAFIQRMRPGKGERGRRLMPRLKVSSPPSADRACPLKPEAAKAPASVRALVPACPR